MMSLLLLVLAAAPQDLPRPEDFFGHRLGEDRKIVPYPRVVQYLERLAERSDRIRLHDLGKSTLGHRLVMAAISTAENLRHAERHAQISRTLLSGAPTEEQARGLARDGKAIVLMTCNIHSTEIASSQTAAEIAYEAVRGRAPLDQVILLLMPSINPDGQIMIQEWYDKHAGTEFEGGPMPRLYHVYAGHDNNRDSYMLNLVETRHVAGVNYRTWFPQVVVDHHQMGSTGGRLWVPPYAEPLNKTVHPLVHRWLNVFGTEMALDLERAGRTGVESRKLFEAYWPGATDSTPWYHNRIGILTESASCRIATPLYVDPSEATAKQENVVSPNPWRGGWWRLRDIVDQQVLASFAILATAARYKEEILLHAWRMAREEAARGGSAAYHVPLAQEDPSAVDRLAEMFSSAGVRLQSDGKSLIVPLGQPSRPYVKNLFEKQVYPLKERPYDVAGWTLPYQLGLRASEGETAGNPVGFPLPRPAARRAAGKYAAADPGNTALFRRANEILASGKKAYRLARPQDGLRAGAFVFANDAALDLRGSDAFDVKGSPEVYELRPPRLGLYQPWAASMDEGWTRLVLESFAFRYETLHNERMKKGDFRKDLDCVILPDVSPDVIREGRPKEAKNNPEVFPPEYRGGIGKEGVEALKKFVEEGGTLVLLDSACDLAIEEWGPPVRNALKNDKEFSCPGSLLRVKVDTSHPLGWGMREEAHVFFTNSPALQTSVPPRVDIDRRVVVRYDEKESPLASGYLNQPDKLKGRSALVEIVWGKGRLVLFAFRPQHRAQTYGTFKMLFNAIQISAAERTTLP